MAAELTVLFDGDCGLCVDLARRLRRWDRARRLELLPLQAPEVATRFPQLRRTELERELHAVETDGTVHAGVAALRRISRLVPRLWGLLPLLRLPLGWHGLYAAVASRRRAPDPRSACEPCRAEVIGGRSSADRGHQPSAALPTRRSLREAARALAADLGIG